MSCVDVPGRSNLNSNVYLYENGCGHITLSAAPDRASPGSFIFPMQCHSNQLFLPQKITKRKM